MSRFRTRAAAVLTAGALALTLAACAGNADPGTDGGADEGYVTPGKLTIATGDPAWDPYVIDNDPASGQGFEAELAYAIAEELGFAAEDVVWVRTDFAEAIAPGPKNFDLNLQQYTITEERKQAVDFSSPYYAASQAIVTIKGYAADGVTTIDGLKGLLLGAMAGSTSATTIEKAIEPTTPALLYNDNSAAKQALEAGQIDAMVLDLPTALFVAAVEIENSVIVGELPTAGVPDEWGVVLPKNSPLTADVSAAIEALRASGRLQEITDTWLGGGLGIASFS